MFLSLCSTCLSYLFLQQLSMPCCVQVMEKQLVVNVEDDPEPGSVEELGQDFISCQGKAHTSPIPLPGSMALPPFSNVVSRQALNIPTRFHGKQSMTPM